jgi:hypothetical protein
MTQLWHNGYGAIPQSARDDDAETNLPGPENVKTIPENWRNAWTWIILIIVPPEISSGSLTGDCGVVWVCFVLASAASRAVDV